MFPELIVMSVKDMSGRRKLRKQYQIVGYCAIIIAVVTTGSFLYQSTNLFDESKDSFTVKAGKIVNLRFNVNEHEASESSQINVRASGNNFGIKVIIPTDQLLDEQTNLESYEVNLATSQVGDYMVIFTNPAEYIGEGAEYTQEVLGVWKSSAIPQIGVGIGGLFLLILGCLSLTFFMGAAYVFYRAEKLRS
jgi:hypothetical protein|tara:strand:- start:1069 stop:1644 length:576 start_codon:yes stop_codon:yes gene_type:complete